MSDIDWRAVNFAVRGVQMPRLSRDEQLMVMRRVRFVEANEVMYPPPGSVTREIVAHRLGLTDRQVSRMANTLPPATPRPCPICGSRAWLHDDSGWVEPHPDSLQVECPLSEHVFAELDHLDMVMVRVEWLRSWLAAGDLHGVGAYVAGLPDEQRQELLVAALYTEPEPESELVAS
jgi:hypothetical protein